MNLDTTQFAAGLTRSRVALSALGAFAAAARSLIPSSTVVDTTPDHARSCGESGTVRRIFPKQRPNQPCLCKSGRKAKHCCR